MRGLHPKREHERRTRLVKGTLPSKKSKAMCHNRISERDMPHTNGPTKGDQTTRQTHCQQLFEHC